MGKLNPPLNFVTDSKRVLGPPHIPTLIKSLEGNTFVRHFLLGNNIIGGVGACAIARFVQTHPDQIETWYLAGNCIDEAGLQRLTSAWVTSNAITNIWLKRNPLGPSAFNEVYRLITETANLRSLDLDQTELGNESVARLFHLLTVSLCPQLPLRHLYLNAVGISTYACQAIALYLESPDCPIESLYVSNNPISDSGAIALAEGLRNNTSLRRLSMSSCGFNTKGVTAIFDALKGHPRISMLNVSQSFATDDLGTR